MSRLLSSEPWSLVRFQVCSPVRSRHGYLIRRQRSNPIKGFVQRVSTNSRAICDRFHARGGHEWPPSVYNGLRSQLRRNRDIEPRGVEIVRRPDRDCHYALASLQRFRSAFFPASRARSVSFHRVHLLAYLSLHSQDLDKFSRKAQERLPSSGQQPALRIMATR